MKKTIILFLILTSTSIFSQKTKKVKENAGFGKAKFHVLLSDGITKHGDYKITSYTPPFRNLTKGQYINGKREGLWVEKYDKSGNKIRVQGNYKNNQRIGIWKFYNAKGDIIHEFDYDKNIFIKNSECGSIREFEVVVNSEIKVMKLSCPPTRIGGLYNFVKGLYNEITFKAPFDINDKGRTKINIEEKVTFWVNKEGEVQDINYSAENENEGLTKIIYDYIEKNKTNWFSGRINDEKLTTKINIPIRINMMF
ncbi:toxin-antitoxin system YwqK family antitoxin [Tenacibaculum discolor]|nr:hypothetical protein [Tenacibaculum discolor]RLK00072.1 hypothetical protein C8N27_1756 [Tenacibaculum discolor]